MAENAGYPTTVSEKEEWLQLGRVIEYPRDRPKDTDVATWDASRTIPSSMLKALFDKQTRICHIPIRLHNAIIDQRLELQYYTCSFDFSLVDCEFRGYADFSFCRFEGTCVLRGSHFLQGATLDSVRCRYDFLVDSSVFEKRASFQAIEVQGRMFARGTHFQDANFANASFRKTAVFSSRIRDDKQEAETNFGGVTKFSDTRFDASAEFDGAQFVGSADFSRSAIAGSARFRPLISKGGETTIRTHFGGEAIFREVSIGGTADFSGSEFSVGEANFRLMKVVGGVYFRPVGDNGSCVRFGGDAVFDGIQIGGRAAFDGAQFQGRASFEGAQIKSNAFFRAVFNRDIPIRFCDEANFRDASIGGTVDFNGAEFHKKAIFSRVTIGGAAFFRAVRPKETTLHPFFREVATFDDLVVSGSISFSGGVFDSEVSFRRMRIGGSAFFGCVSFQGNELLETTFRQDSYFSDVHFSGNADFKGVHFAGATYWDRATIDGAAYFGIAEIQALISVTRFDHGAYFRDVELKGRADFSGVLFGAGANFVRTKFNGGAVFSSVQRKSQQLITRVSGGPMRFVRAVVHGDLEFEGTEFDDQADFAAMTVGGNALFRTAHFPKSGALPAQSVITIFKAGAIFTDATIDGVADFTGSRFLGIASFARIKVGGPILFRRTPRVEKDAPTFQEAVFARAVLSGGADFDGVRFAGPANFAVAVFGASARFTRLHCEKDADFSRIALDGTANFQGSTFAGNVSFEDARIDVSDFGDEENDRVSFRGKVSLHGFTYSRIVMEWRDLFTRIPRGHLQPYAQLEKVFRSAGYDRDADEVYLARRDMERAMMKDRIWRRATEQRAPLGDAVEGITKLVEDSAIRWLFNYGIPSYRLLAYALVIFAVGTAVLTAPGALRSQTDATIMTAQLYGRAPVAAATFLASVLPGDKAKVLTSWKPSCLPIDGIHSPTFEQFTVLMSALIYLCVTGAVASLTGLIKRKQP
jgi:uncharacterized protein YjbI with pentapeptide repeats